MHHAIYDGAAISLLQEEVEKVYWNRDTGPAISPEPFLREMLGLNFPAAHEFWGHHLHNFEPVKFPDLTGRSSAAKRSMTGSSVSSRQLNVPLEHIETACRSQGMSLLSLCQAAWAKVLTAYTGESDVCFGNVLSGRTLPVTGIERLVFPCFNTLPVRVKISPASTNSDVLKILTIFNAKCLPFQLTPLRRIKSWISSTSERLFDSLLILQHPARVLDNSIWSLDSDVGEMDIPVVCELLPSHFNDTLSVVLHSLRTVVLEEDTHLIFKLFEEAVHSLIQDPTKMALDWTISDLKLLAISNSEPSAAQPICGELIHSGFAEQVHLRPNALALDFWKDSGNRALWSFSDLDRESSTIALHLHEHGVELEEAVPICMPKSPTFYASILAVLKYGAAFTPIDDQAPSGRKRFMVEQLDAKVILYCNSVDMSWCARTCINVSDFPKSQSSVMSRCPLVKSHNLAYRLYTSGSTGQPKAVSVEHRQVVHTLSASRSIIPWSDRTRLLNFAAITFDMCYYDIFMALSYGFTLCSASQNRLFDEIPNVISEMKISMLDLTPSVAFTINPEKAPSVEYLYCIGEAMPQQLADTWYPKCVNSYGPTEAAMCVSIFRTSPAIKSFVFGKPFPTVSFIVLQRWTSRPAPVLGVGELCIGGSQVAREYHANQKLTAKRFGNCDGRRFYKTGDLVRMLGDGYFEFIGRLDDQVKIRGQRIELEEINTVIKETHTKINTVSTQVLRVTESSMDQLVAFLAVSPRIRQEQEEQIKVAASNTASSMLPAYMVPTVYLVLEKLPFSAAGKIDKRALAKIYRDNSQIAPTETEYGVSKELTSQEQLIRDTFSSFAPDFKIEDIRHSTSIYSLGLDSITATQIANRLRQAGYRCSAVDVLERPTVVRLAELIADQIEASPNGKSGGTKIQELVDLGAFDSDNRLKVCSKLSISITSVAAIRPCTPLQNGMVAQFMHSKGRAYFNHTEMSLGPSLNIDQLRDAWDIVLEKHEMLRTGFVQTERSGSPFAMITYRARKASLPYSELPKFQHSRLWRQEIAQEVLLSLQEPPWRLRILKISDKEQASSNRGHTMLFSAHHALYDAQSLSVIFTDLAHAYHGRRVSLSPSLDPVLSHVLQWSFEESLDQQHFWKELGQRTTSSRFPEMTPLHVCSGEQLVSCKTSLGLIELEKACRHAGVSMQAAVQRAWASVLSQYVDEPNVTFGTVLSGRSFGGAEDVVFPLITTLPVPINMNKGAHDAMQDLMNLSTSLLRFQFTPLARAKQLMCKQEELLFDTILVYQKAAAMNEESYLCKMVDEKATADVSVHAL